MDIDEIMRQHWKTRRHLTSAVVGASGWNLGQFDGPASVEPSVHVYVYDLPTGWTWMGSIPKRTFLETSERASKRQNGWDVIRGALGYILTGAAEGNNVGEVNGMDWEHQLAAAMSAYAGTTKVWEMAQQFRPGGHFIVLSYRKPGERDTLLRPFGIGPKPGGENEVLSVEYLMNAIEQAIQMDRINHPNWFE